MAEKEVLVKVEGVSKKFSKDLKTGLKYGLQDLFTNVLGGGRSDQLRPKEFWAVQDISFELRRGECLGLIGHNGAGKSTLLKMLNGLIRPDTGSITMKGRVGALIELGAGFNPILTGRENIYNNGAVLGFSKKEIDKKLDTIIEFAELAEFIDMPVQHYSSGMKVRLGFAVAAQMEPDVLLIDEVLAVGDLGFVLKCFKTIDAILPNTAMIFVSHSMPMISRICSDIILMENGLVSYQGTNVSKGIDFYYQRFASNESSVVFTNNSIDLINARLVGIESVDNIYSLSWGDSITLEFTCKNNRLKTIPFITMAVYDKEQRGIAEIIPEGQVLDRNVAEMEKIIFTFNLNNVNLSKGLYYITFTASRSLNEGVFYKIHNAITLKVNHKNQIWTPFLIDAELVNVK